MNPTPSDFGKSSQATVWRAVPIYPTQCAYIQTMRNHSAAHRLFFLRDMVISLRKGKRHEQSTRCCGCRS